MQYDYSYELTERFLNLYRKLESYKGKNPKGYDFYKRKYGDELNLFRELRNYLSHEEYKGSYPFAVSEAIVTSLEKILNEMNLTCGRVMNKNISVAYEETSLRAVIDTMKEKQFSYVPIIDKNKRVIGMISSESIVAMISDKASLEGKISEAREYFSLNNQSKKFIFLGRNDSFSIAERSFTALQSDKKRVGIILITETGSAKEALLGVISPYDVFENN